MNKTLTALVLATFLVPAQAQAPAGMERLLQAARKVAQLTRCMGAMRDSLVLPAPKDAADLKLVQAGAAAGHVDCQLLLGNWLASGQGEALGLARDLEQARQQFQDAAAQGGLGKAALADLKLLEGDAAAARTLYEQALADAKPGGELGLARLVLHMDRDEPGALRLLRQAMARGELRAWVALHELPNYLSLAGPAERAQDQARWLGLLQRRLQSRLENLPALQRLSGEYLSLWRLEFAQSNQGPALRNEQSSGDAALDAAISAKLNNLVLPPPPPDGKPWPRQFQFPLRLVGALQPLASAPASAP